MLETSALQKHLKQPISRIVEGLRPPKNEAAGKQLAAGIAATAMAIRLLPEVGGKSETIAANAARSAVDHCPESHRSISAGNLKIALSGSQAFGEQADALSGFVMGELAHCGDMTRSKGSSGMVHHPLLDVHISSMLHLQLAALKVGQATEGHRRVRISCCLHTLRSPWPEAAGPNNVYLSFSLI